MKNQRLRIGLALVAVGVSASAILRPFNMDGPAGEGFAFGVGVVQLVALVTGICFIIAHFIRKKKSVEPDDRNGQAKDGTSS
jgi:hypothetical protein